MRERTSLRRVAFTCPLLGAILLRGAQRTRQMTQNRDVEARS